MQTIRLLPALTWPKLTGAGGPTLQLNPAGIRTVSVASEHHCAFWTSIQPSP